MSRSLRVLLATGFAAATLAVPTAAFASHDDPNWGSAVSGCNTNNNCAYGSGPRGGFVREQARDDDGRGYGTEIHRDANPGHSNPGGHR